MNDDERSEAWFAQLELIEEDVAESGSDNSAADVLSAALAEVEGRAAQNLAEAEGRAHAEVEALRRAEIAIMRRDFRLLRAALDGARRTHAEAAAKAGARIASLERNKREMGEQINELRKILAGLEQSVARDRSLRRLEAGRRSYPAGDRVKLEAARRKTDRALSGASP